MKSKISQEEIEKVAKELHEEQFLYSEAYPVKRWISRGYPSPDTNVFKAIDAYLFYLRSLEKLNS